MHLNMGQLVSFNDSMPNKQKNRLGVCHSGKTALEVQAKDLSTWHMAFQPESQGKHRKKSD